MFHDRLDNNIRRLDQSMQHVISTMFSFALSGSIKYAALNLIVNARGIVLLWKKDTSNDGKRWVAIMYCVMLYTLPMLYRGDAINFFTAAISMFLGGILFVPEYNSRFCAGWGHTVFHAVLMINTQALINSARKIKMQ